jgi:serine/threonine protein kinase
MCRDIKSDNILLQNKWTNVDSLLLKISDFGLSSESEMRKTLCGTPFYLACLYFIFIYTRYVGD